MTDFRPPLVTVALPARNAERTLASALGSIRSQTYSDWELIVIDDGSTDGSRGVIRAFAESDPRIVPIFHKQSLGPAVRLNEIIGRARGQMVARMDADDISYPDRLERQVVFLLANPVVNLVGSSMTVFHDASRALRKWPAPPTHGAICRRPAVGFRLFHPTWMGRTGWFRKHLYRPAAHRSEDQELLLRSHRQSVFANLEEPLLGYRQPRMKAGPRLAGRFNYLRIGWPILVGDQGPRVTTGVGWHLFRGGIDTAAVALGVEESIFRRLGVSLSSFEQQRWRIAREAAVRGLPPGTLECDLRPAA